MKILQVVQKPQRRGAETFAYQLSGQLRCDGGHEVSIVYLYPHSGDEALPVEAPDRCLAGDEAHVSERTLGFHPGLLSRLVRHIDRTEPDIVQVNGARTVKYGALCRLRRPSASWALVYRNIGDPRLWVADWWTRLFYDRIVMPRLDGVVGVSETTLQALRDFYGLRIPTAQIPRAVDPFTLRPERSRQEVRRELDVDEEDPVMVYVGSLTREKRVDRLLRVLERAGVTVSDLRLWLVGDGPLRRQLQERAAALELGGRVRFLGVRPDVATWMAAADLLVLASDTEGVPGVILEAGWLRLPVVATDVGGVSECVVDGETGLLVDPEDEEEFAGAVTRLAGDPAARRTLGDRGRARVEERYTLDRIARRYVEFYRRVRAT